MIVDVEHNADIVTRTQIGEGERTIRKKAMGRSATFSRMTGKARQAFMRLPKSGDDVWPEADRKLWLQLLEGSFKLIYKDWLSMREQAERARLENETKDEAATTEAGIRKAPPKRG